jgi:hypothetical protein
MLVLGMETDAWSACAARAERHAASFARRADHAVQRCVRRSERLGTPCPDARLAARLDRLRAGILRLVGKHCDAARVAARLSALHDRIFCHRLGRCGTRFGSLRLTVAAATTPDAALSRHLEVDSGWTGIAHDLRILEGAGFVSELTACGAAGDARCELFARTAGTPFGAPSPIDAGGIPVCVVIDYASDVVGHVDLATGALTESARVAIAVHADGLPDAPCPACEPHQGEPALGAAGVCAAGANAGGACVVGGLADPAYGHQRGTSSDCPPASAPVGRFLTNGTATTGTVELAAVLPCAHGGGACWCADQDRANACHDGVCTATPEGGVCAAGPVDGRCRLEVLRHCIDDLDCPAAGDACEDHPRRCFPDVIHLAGTLDPPVDAVAHPTLVGAFCMASASAAVNRAAGYPGPTTFVWPAEVRFAE